MRVSINENNEVINFLWGPGYDDRPIEANEREVVSYNFDTDLHGTGTNINDKELNRIKRYTINVSGVVQRRTDVEIKAMPEHVNNITRDKFWKLARLDSGKETCSKIITNASLPQNMKDIAVTIKAELTKEIQDLLGL